MRRSATARQVNAHGTIVDVDVLVRPAPIPDLVDSGADPIEGQVSHGELLVTNVESELASGEDQVVHEATRSFLDEDADVLSVRRAAHLEHDILQTCSLASRPMSTGDGAGYWNQRCVDDQVSDLSPEHVRGTVPSQRSLKIVKTYNYTYPPNCSFPLLPYGTPSMTPIVPAALAKPGAARIVGIHFGFPII